MTAGIADACLLTVPVSLGFQGISLLGSLALGSGWHYYEHLCILFEIGLYAPVLIVVVAVLSLCCKQPLLLR
jgi:hypothetical protein